MLNTPVLMDILELRSEDSTWMGDCLETLGAPDIGSSLGTAQRQC